MRLIHFSARRFNQVFTAPLRLLGKWRLFLNYCPECNSCAPKLHQCEVCGADTKAHFAWNEEVEKTWWKRYAEKHRFAA